MHVNVVKKLTLRLQVCKGVILVHSVSLQVQDQVQLCCFGNASADQRLGYSVSSTGGFGKHQNQDLRPGNVHENLRKQDVPNFMLSFVKDGL